MKHTVFTDVFEEDNGILVFPRIEKGSNELMDNEQITQLIRRVNELIKENAQGWQIGEHLESIKKLVNKEEFEQVLRDLGISEDLASQMMSSFDLVIDFMKRSADSELNIDNGKFIQAYNQLSSEEQYKLADSVTSDELIQRFTDDEITIGSELEEYSTVLVDLVESNSKTENLVEDKSNYVRQADVIEEGSNADDRFYVNNLDYSSLPSSDREFLENADRQLLHIYRSYTLDIGEVLSKAQEYFSNKGNVPENALTFEKWFKAWGFSKSRVYECISQYKYIQEQSKKLDSDGRRKLLDDFESLPAKARSKVAAQSTDEELRQELLTANITSNAQYKQVLEEYNQTKKALKEAEAEKQEVITNNQKLQSQLTETTQKVSRQQDALLKGETERHKLESKLHDQEENPITVEQIPDDYYQLQQEHEQLITRVQTLTAERDDNVEKRAELEDRLNELSSNQEREELETELQLKQRELAELEKQIDQSESNLEQADNKIAANDRINDLLDRVQEALDDAARMLVPSDLRLFAPDSSQIELIENMIINVKGFAQTAENTLNNLSSSEAVTGEILDPNGQALND